MNKRKISIIIALIAIIMIVVGIFIMLGDKEQKIKKYIK